MAMMARTGRILTVFLATLVLFAGQWPSVCHAWSIWHPLTFDSTPQPKPRTTALKSTQKPPSTFDQIVSAPKNLVTKVGNTITGKKSEPVKPPPTMIARPTPPVLDSPKKSSSWVPSFLQTEQPKPAKTVPEWMAQPRVGE